MKDDSLTKLLWIDMEMTGLDVEIEVPIEVAAVVTDMQLNQLGTPYHAVIRQPDDFIENMDDWNKTHHSQSGLLDRIPKGKQPDLVEKELCQFIDDHFDGQKAILCGNSIFQDRKFIDKYMPKVSDRLHYRLLDVTSWKIIMENCFDVSHDKKDAHRATDDIFESIEELKTYLKHVQKI
ncbi:MAG: oligoribonuclease [Bdellovibrionales bacterium]